MADESHLDLQYFIDTFKYNCPFCNRRHVTYHVEQPPRRFDWSEGKKCYAYFVQCDSCAGLSMHLSFTEIATDNPGSNYSYRRFKVADDSDLDALFFYSVPSSFFVMDDRIPSVIRDLITEAESCKKMNFLTGASACARKAIYEFLVKEKAEGDHYE